jgi:hypothetical protein
MAIRDDVVVGQDVGAQLGGALDVLASLWALDCQSCNRPLPGRRPALSVDDMVSFASANVCEWTLGAWPAGESLNHAAVLDP